VSTDYTTWTDDDLAVLYKSLGERVSALINQQMEIVAAQALRRVAARRHMRADWQQQDADEYREEMSLGGRPYNTERFR
jgi:hypothetical protein